MFTIKQYIATKVQEILMGVGNDELPVDGEIHFILHVDGVEDWSWANIRNNNDLLADVPKALVGNLTV